MLCWSVFLIEDYQFDFLNMPNKTMAGITFCLAACFVIHRIALYFEKRFFE